MRRASALPFLSLALLSCAPGLNGPLPPPGSLRLTPIAVTASPATDVSALFDRDTTTALQITAPTTLTLTFAHGVEVRSLKVFGAQGLSLQLGSQVAQTVDAAGQWKQVAQVPMGQLSQWTVTLAPAAGSAGLAELELWGAGTGSAPRDGNTLAAASAGGASLPFDNAFAVASSS